MSLSILSRLRELSALTEGKEELTETKHDKAFAGIARIVDDALGDLNDKLGKGGSLAELMKTSGASKLDKTKDAEGNTILKAIIMKTTAYKKDIERLLMDAEMLVMQMNEEQSLSEATGNYDGSVDFTAELNKLEARVVDVKTIVKNPRWIQYLKATDNNFGTNCEGIGKDVISSLNELDASLSELEDELDRAE